MAEDREASLEELFLKFIQDPEAFEKLIDNIDECLRRIEEEDIVD